MLTHIKNTLIVSFAAESAKNDEELKNYIVTSAEDNAIINSEMIKEMLGNKEKIKKLYKEWKEKYNKKAQESKIIFIEK